LLSTRAALTISMMMRTPRPVAERMTIWRPDPSGMARSSPAIATTPPTSMGTTAAPNNNSSRRCWLPIAAVMMERTAAAIAVVNAT
jgi:hypothetical protein